MKINLSNNSMGSDKNIFKMSDRQYRYCISRAKSPEKMRDYLSGNWFKAAAKAVSSGISNATQAAINIIKPTKDIPLVPVYNSFQVLDSSTKAPTTVFTPETVENTDLQTIRNVVAQDSIKRAELANLESERLKLLKKQQDEAAAIALEAAKAASQIQTTSPAFNYKKYLPYAALLLVPLLMGEE